MPPIVRVSLLRHHFGAFEQGLLLCRERRYNENVIGTLGDQLRVANEELAIANKKLSRLKRKNTTGRHFGLLTIGEKGFDDAEGERVCDKCDERKIFCDNKNAENNNNEQRKKRAR